MLIKIILLILLLIIAVASGYFALKIFNQLFFDRKIVVLAEDFLITTEPKEVVSSKLTVEKENQFVGLVLESNYEEDLPRGIKMPNGEIVTPEIKLIDNKGKEYLLKFDSAVNPASDGSQIAQFSYLGGYNTLPIGKSFEKIVLKCEKPIKIKRIIWSGYDTNDMK